jgi:hypothetical protein
VGRTGGTGEEKGDEEKGGEEEGTAQEGREKGVMNFRGQANRKLYHAAILVRMLRAELSRQELPAHVVLESVGLAVRQHLLEAYGWFLLELAGIEDISRGPPPGLAALQQAYGVSEPLRGELVELQQMEREGWLAELLAPPAPTGAAPAAGPDGLAVREQVWSEAQLQSWHDKLAELFDRMSHGLDEW